MAETEVLPFLSCILSNFTIYQTQQNTNCSLLFFIIKNTYNSIETADNATEFTLSQS